MVTKREMLKHEQWIREIVRDETKILIEQEIRKQLQEEAASMSKEMTKTFRMLLKR